MRQERFIDESGGFRNNDFQMRRNPFIKVTNNSWVGAALQSTMASAKRKRWHFSRIGATVLILNVPRA